MNLLHRVSLVFLALCFILSSCLLKYQQNKYLFDRHFSWFIQKKDDVSFTINEIQKTSLFTEISFSTIDKPVFIIEINNNIIYLNKSCQILQNIQPNDKNNLIKLECNNQFQHVSSIFHMIKHLNVVSMELIDNRRWSIKINKNNRIITIEFPEGIPDIKLFEKLDKKYKFSDKYNYIDLRFNNKVAVNNE